MFRFPCYHSLFYDKEIQGVFWLRSLFRNKNGSRIIGFVKKPKGVGVCGESACFSLESITFQAERIHHEQYVVYQCLVEDMDDQSRVVVFSVFSVLLKDKASERW